MTPGLPRELKPKGPTLINGRGGSQVAFVQLLDLLCVMVNYMCQLNQAPEC